MQTLVIVSAALILSSVTPAFAQDWGEFVSREDGFAVNFPGEPTVTETTYTSEYGAELPARVYSARRGEGRYSVTVVDYRPAEAILTERSKDCPPYADSRCTGQVPIESGHWKIDVRGALVWASWQLIQRDVKVTDYSWSLVELVEGHHLQLTNADQSRTFAAIHLHDNRLYVLEGTVPAGYPEPGLFQQSLSFVGQDGNRVRYRDFYDNDYPPPALVDGPLPDGDAEGEYRE